VGAFRAGWLSLEVAVVVSVGIQGPYSLVAKFRFPETETAVAETGSIKALLRGEAEHLVLAGPFHRQVEQTGGTHAVR
jgi:hypothetical protein